MGTPSAALGSRRNNPYYSACSEVKKLKRRVEQQETWNIDVSSETAIRKSFPNLHLCSINPKRAVTPPMIRSRHGVQRQTYLICPMAWRRLATQVATVRRIFCAAYGRAWGYGHVHLLNHESSERVPFQSPIGELRRQAGRSLQSRMNAVQT
jgi:hypothetical protein